MNIKQFLKSIFLILGIFLSFSGKTAEIKLSASAPKQVSNGEQFQVTYSLNTNGSGFVSPQFPDFDFLGGPSQSTSMSIMNGAMTQSISFTFYLRAKKEGTFTIKPARIKVNGSDVESSSLSIVVTKSDPAAVQKRQQQKRQQQILDPFGNLFEDAEPQQQSQEVIKANGQDIFVRINVDKRKVYQGEPIIANLKIYTRVNLAGFQDIKFPAFTGFWSEEIQSNTQIDLKPETIDGIQYQVGTFKQIVLTPQKSGSISIDAFEVDAVVQQRTNRRRSIFDVFGGVENVEVKLKSQPIKVEVVSWPTPKPNDFSGISGKLKMSASLDKSSTKTNEAVNLKLTLSGSGNLKLLEAPKLTFPPDVEAYDPKTNDKINVNQAGISGSRTFEYLLIPRYAGDFKIDPISISYFDLDKKQYITLSQPEIILHVDKGDGQAESPMVTTSTNKEDLKIIGQDIRYIKTTTPSFSKHGEYFFGSPVHIAGMILPISLFGLFVVVFNRRKNQQADMGFVKNRRATKLARKRLAKAEKLLKSNNTAEFYEEVSRALWGYVSDKLLIEVSELTKDNVKDKLIQRGTREDLIDNFLRTLNDTEFARYAPSAAGLSANQVLANAIKTIVELEG